MSLVFSFSFFPTAPSLFHLSHTPVQMFEHVDELTPALLKTLSDESDAVVQADLDVLAQMSSAKPDDAVERKEQVQQFFNR